MWGLAEKYLTIYLDSRSIWEMVGWHRYEIYNKIRNKHRKRNEFPARIRQRYITTRKRNRSSSLEMKEKAKDSAALCFGIYSGIYNNLDNKIYCVSLVEYKNSCWPIWEYHSLSGTYIKFLANPLE